jgi:ribosome-binding factor A
MSRRVERVNHVIRDRICEVLQREIRDPRLSSFTSITEVHTSPDMKYAKVFVSVMGTEEEKTQTLQALTRASGFFARELREYLPMRLIPELSFTLDNSIEHGAQVLELLRNTTTENNPENKDDSED